MSDLQGVSKAGKIPIKFEPLAFLEKWKDLVTSDFCVVTTGWRAGMRARGHIGRWAGGTHKDRATDWLSRGSHLARCTNFWPVSGL